MSRCPVCKSFQVVLEVAAWPDSNRGARPPDPMHGRCPQCGAQWEQRGDRVLVDATTAPPQASRRRG
jgi:hypothetical protein